MAELDALDWCRQRQAEIRFGTLGCALIQLDGHPQSPFIGQTFLAAVRAAREADEERRAQALTALINAAIAEDSTHSDF